MLGQVHRGEDRTMPRGLILEPLISGDFDNGALVDGPGIHNVV